MAKLKEVIDWAREQPRTEETRREVIRRYAGMLQGARHFKIMQFFERNQTVAKTLQSGDAMRTQMMELMDVLSDPSDPPAVQLRRSHGDLRDPRELVRLQRAERPRGAGPQRPASRSPST